MKTELIYLELEYPFLKGKSNDARLTTYLPYNMKEMERQSDKRPCMLVLPGGGYYFTSERESEPIALHFLEAGYNVFVLNYSVDPARFPTQMLEVACAFDLIYKKADEWNCDTDRIAVMGFSAGGHLCAHYSTSYACDEIREFIPDSKKPAASVLCYPVISAYKGEGHMDSFGCLLGRKPTEEDQEKFSCHKLVTNDTPPAFIWTTFEDTSVPVYGALYYAKALKDHDINCEFHMFGFGWHGLSTCLDDTTNSLEPEYRRDSQWMSLCKEWLDIIFKGEKE